MEKREIFKEDVCYCCANDHQVQSCPYKKSVCHKCNKVGHLARKCHSRQKNQPHQRKQLVTFVSAKQEMVFYTVYTCNAGGVKPIYVTVELCGKSVVMQLDKESAVAYPRVAIPGTFGSSNSKQK